MLSIYTLKSANQAAHYYEQGDYYIKGDNLENNVWFGKGAVELGLIGTVDASQFKNLLEGKLPNGVVLHNGYDKDGNPKHRPGYDLTFSACKSASILAIVGGDIRITHAHISAVKSVLTKIENEMTGSRIKKSGVIEVAKTNNVTVAMFNHTDSRLLDPNLHTHCILLNITKLEGKWRTLYGDDFYNYKMALGLEYRMHFAQNLMQLGYEIEQTTKNGLFEIVNVPKDLIAHFSKRRAEIEKIIADTGRDSSDKISFTVNKGTKFEKIVNTTVSSMATLYSRAKKRTLHKDELQQHWIGQLHLAGYDKSALDNIIEKSKDIGQLQPDNPAKTLSDAIPLALEHLTANRHMFAEKELLYAIKSLCLKSNISDNQVIKQINNFKKQGNILTCHNGFLTTRNAQNIEKENIELIAKNKDLSFAMLPIIAPFLVKNLVRDENKIGALVTILSSKDTFLGIESSNDKQTHDLLKTLVKFTPHCTYYSLSKNHKAATNLANNIGATKAFSIHEFIKYTDRLVSDKNLVKNLFTVWIIDNSQQLSYNQVNSLLKNANQLAAKILFTGDSFRITNMSQNNAFQQLIEHKLSTVTLQANTQMAASFIKNAQIMQALSALAQNSQINYIANSKQRFDVACVYMASIEQATLLVQNKAMVMEANKLIRKLKIANGSIHGTTLQAETLAPIPLSVQEKSTIVSFNVGDVIRFNSSIQNTIFKQGTYYTIIDVNAKNNTITLGADNNELHLNFTDNVGRKLSVYRTQTLELQIGDNLIWNDATPIKLNPNRNSIGDALTVIEIKGKNVQVLGKSGIQTLNLDNKIAQHLDYNYAKTIPNSSLQQNINGAILIEPNRFPSVTPQDLYSAIKSFTNEPVIFSPEKGDLLHGLQANNQKMDTAISASALVDSRLNAIHIQESAATWLEVNLGAQTAVEYAIAKLAERDAVFKIKDLEYIAFAYDIKTPINDLRQAIIELEAGGTLIKVDKNNYVFKASYDCERACLSIMEGGVDKVQAIVTAQHQALKNIDANTMLTVGQKEAVCAILTTTDRITLIQGVAGSGKTTMLKEVKSIARDNGYELIGLATTASAKLNLHLKSIGADFNENNPETFIHSGIPAQTLASFLITGQKMLATNQELAKAAYPKNTVLVLDEASLVSARAMKSLLEITEKLNLRLVVIGDDRQLPAIEASRIFSLMLGAANNVVNMNINTRLKTPESLEIMQLIYASNLNPDLLDMAFAKMQQNIVEIPSKLERLQLMANYYTGVSLVKRDDILPMLPENKDRIIFNSLVRENLKKEGSLSGVELSAPIMVAKDLTTPEKNYALSFEIGDLVRFNSNIARLNIKADSYYQVLDVNREQLILCDDFGAKTSWSPFSHARGNVEVYRQETREIMAGDSIRWRRNFEDKGIINGDIANVLAVQDNILSVRLANGKQYVIDVKDRCNQHFDHAYGSTVHVAQGLDKPNPIGLLDGPKPYQIESAVVSVGSMVVIPGNAYKNITSKIGQVIASNIKDKNCELTVIDRAGQKQQLNDKFVEVYPDFNKTNYPSLANICNFLVQATRGDNFIVFVDNVEGYKASLKHSLEHLKQTALEMIDVQKGLEIKTKVAQMTALVFGLAKPEELKNRLLSIDTTSASVTKFSENLNLNFAKNRGKFSKTKNQVKDLQQQNDIKQVTKLYNLAQSISGTIAEKYLKHVCGIKAGIPEDFKYLSRCWHKDLRTQKPALLIPAFGRDGKLQSLNRIYLGPDANKLNIMVTSSSNALIQATQKAVLGPSKAATVFINKVPNSTVTYVAEGIETALAVRQAVTEANISSCFGITNLKDITLGANTKMVVICAYNDGNSVTSKKILEQTIAKFLNAGLEVKLALPLNIDPSVKYNYNQMLQEGGEKAIATSLQQAVKINSILDLGSSNTPLCRAYSHLHHSQFGKKLEPEIKSYTIEKQF